MLIGSKSQCCILLRYLENSVHSYKVCISLLLIQNHHWSLFHLDVLYHWCRTQTVWQVKFKVSFTFPCFNVFYFKESKQDKQESFRENKYHQPDGSFVWAVSFGSPVSRDKSCMLKGSFPCSYQCLKRSLFWEAACFKVLYLQQAVVTFQLIPYIQPLHITIEIIASSQEELSSY